MHDPVSPARPIRLPPFLFTIPPLHKRQVVLSSIKPAFVHAMMMSMIAMLCVNVSGLNGTIVSWGALDVVLEGSSSAGGLM